MKIIKLSLCISMVGAFATLPPAYANEVVTNCTQVTDTGGSDSNTNNNESCAAVTIPFDFGDAPETFPVLLANGGARHQLGTNVYLGKCVDGDSGELQGEASADDADESQPVYGVCETDAFGKQDDEDGVAIAELRVGDTESTVQVTTSADCKLNAWVDWNQDGSWGGAGEQVFLDQQLTAGLNNLTMDVPAFAAEGTAYTRFRCSTAGGDGIGGEAIDGEVEDYKLTILPAIPKVPVSVGDKIWIDANQNGQQDADETGLAGATVTLLDKDGNPVNDLDGKPVAAVTTDGGGAYVFGNLAEGQYLIRVETPEGYLPTQGGTDVDDDVSNTDSNCQVVDGKTQTSDFSLTTDNMTVDCGFYMPTQPVHSIGNMVWVDDGAGDKTNADNGQFDEGEALLNGIKLELRDTTGAVIESTMTSGGYYLFSGLNAGEYQVCVAATNFKGMGKLVGYTAGVNGKEADANTGGDSNDNGGELSADGICSNFIVLNDQEPTSELPTALGTAGDDGMGTEDSRSNLTVDFAVLPPAVAPKAVSVGDRVWIDTNENGQQDAGETGLSGATVTLLDKSGNPVNDLDGKPVAAVTTAADGVYLFENLPEGEYLIRVEAPEGYIGTQGGADVDDDASNTDSNCQVVDGKTQTSPFNLTTDTLAADCGFYQPKAPVHSLGNRVWVDANNNGLADKGELPASAGITLALKDAEGTVISSTTTDAEGRYVFSGLAAGNYQVCVVADNFATGSLLEGYTASTGGTVADANTDIDGDDNGTDDLAQGLCTNLVTLNDQEPTLEVTASGDDGNDGVGTEDQRSNLTIDFGIVPPVAPPKAVSVGDRVWLDTNENGQQDEGEAGLSGAVVTLLDKDGNPVNDLDGKPVAAFTTVADGLYLFDNLPEGEYLIRVDAPEGYVATQGGADVDDDASNTDSNCQVVDGKTQTSAFNLTTDTLTVDCGFYLPKAPIHSVGNSVWVDANNNGLFDKGEQPVVDGVVMELLDKSGTVMAYTETKDGYYLFSGLAAGEYSVCVAHGNFDAGLLKGYTPSNTGDETDVNDGIDNGDNGDNDTQDGLCSNVIILDDKNPTGEQPTASGTAGDDGMGTDDNRSNLTIDFGVVPPVVEPPKVVSVGDTLWIDTNENGQQDEGEAGLAGAEVTLLNKDGSTVVIEGDMAVAPVITTEDGKYLFSNLPEGEYLISVKAPEGYVVTQGGADVDEDASNTDSNCQVVDGKTQTSPFNLTTDNLTVDCGFYMPKAPTHSIGNTVWVDANNNGLLDAEESKVVDGVVMELLDKSGTVMAYTETKDGYYLFSGLAAGEYSVCVAHGNFDEGLLKGYTGSPVMEAAGDNRNSGDSDTQDGLCSNVIVLDDKQPTDEAPTASGTTGDDGMGTDDNRSNLAVDFGVVPPEVEPPKTVSVGDFIWIDANENGQQDEGETGLAGATVTLLDKSGNPVSNIDGVAVAPVTTGVDGKYTFINLPEGEYQIRVETPEGYLPTQGVTDALASNTDSNCQVMDGKLQTSLFSLTADTTAVDCGFYQPKAPTHSLGNMVWIDNGEGDNANNGLFDTGETLPGNVVMELRDSTDALVNTTQTAGGYYLFSGLAAGEYKVCVAGSNFNAGAALEGYTASITGKELNANLNGDSNDNGDSTASDGLCSNLIVLDGEEPTGEQPTASGIAGDDGMGTEDNRSNLTVDFAVVPVEPVDPGTPVSVGNQIWIDSNANGQREEGESFLENAVVTLTDASGRSVMDLDGNSVAPHTTGADGLYLFENLPEGEYIVTVEPPEGFFPTIGGIDVDDDASDIDSNCRVNPINNTVETHPFTLAAGSEPDADGDDTNGNMTVDCGFYGSVSLGDRVWLDGNANGQQDNAETGINGVSVSLMEEDGITPATDISGKPVAAVMTDENGNYLFPNLKPGNYIVVVNPGTDSGYSLTKGGADPDTDPSNTDSNCKVAAGQFQTPAVTLTPGKEPNDNGFSDLTVDCGMLRPVNLGSRLWLDLDGDGKQDGGEPGIPGATVTLLTVDGKPVTDIFGDVLKPQTTDSDGKYFFGNLREGDYVVKVVPPAGYLPTVGGEDPNDDDATDSNGVLNADGSIISKPINLKWGDEPEDGGATNTTVGFGLVANLHVPTLSQWGMAIMSMLLATAAFFRRRRED